MPRDYKNHTHHKKFKRTKKPKLNGLDVLFILGFMVIAFLFITFFLSPGLPKAMIDLEIGHLLSAHNIKKSHTAELVAKKQLQNKNIQQLAAKAQAKIKQTLAPAIKPNKISKKPRFDFYTILPELEVVIPEHEIKTRIREEQIGTLKKNGKYIMQAGSFRDFLEAKRFHNKLTAMGIKSHIERAKVENVIWNRIKMGPFFGLSAVMVIKTRLRNNGIDSLVLEFKG